MNDFISVKASIDDTKSVRQDDLAYLISQTIVRKYLGWPNITQNLVNAQLLHEIQSSNESSNCLLFYNKAEPCGFISIDRLAWDSNYFNFGCYKIGHLLVSSRLARSEQCELATQMVQKALKDCGPEARFVFSDADSWSEYHNLSLQSSGFRYVLTWVDIVYLGKGYIFDLPQGHSASPYKASDYSAINKFVATTYFEGGRFFLDHNFSTLNPCGIYESLFENSITNGDEVYVYRIDGIPVGFFICKKPFTYEHMNDLKVAPLRFIVIDPQYRGMGIASNFFKAFMNYFVNSGHLIVSGLEIHNIPSLNLNSKLGFNFNYTHNAYHAWL